MKPYKSYMSLYKGSGKPNKALFALLVFQIILLCLLKTTIAIPEAFAKNLSEKYETDGIAFHYSNIDFSLPNQLKVERLTVRKDGRPVIEIKDLSLKCSLLRLAWFELGDLERVRAEEIHFYSPDRDRPILSFTDTQIKKNAKSQHLISSSLSLEQKVISIRGVIDFHYLRSLFAKKGRKSADNLVDRLLANLDQIVLWTKGVPPLHLQAFANATPSGMLCITQAPLPDKETGNHSNQVNGLNTFLKISTEEGENHSLSVKSSIDDFSLKAKSVQLTFEDVSLATPSIRFKKLNDLKDDLGGTSLSVRRIGFAGRLQGHLPSFNIISKSTEYPAEGILFSDSNRTRMALSYKYTSFISLHGEARITPKNFDLYCDTKKGNLRVLDGDEVHACLFKNEMESKVTAPMLFQVNADRLSVMETPEGAYDLSGRIAPDYSIFVDSAWGKLGSSEVKGTYTQSWNPHNFRFLLKGKCLPTDINNWLGNWWKRIWLEFAFSEAIPRGDFSISGNWQDSGSSTITEGIVQSKAVVFRGLPLTQSTLKVFGDGNSTQIEASASHDKGNLNGNLSIPRNPKFTNTPLKFLFKGDFPLDDGKKVFGQEVEEILSDFNSSVVSCEAGGSIYLNKTEGSGEDNKTAYKIKISTDTNASLWGVPVSQIHGELNYHDSVTVGSFPSIGIAEGKAFLDFQSKNTLGNDSLSFKFHLQKADRYAISSIISNLSFLEAEDRDQIKETVKTLKNTSGTVDLSLQAKGPHNNRLQFEGTGHLRLVEESLSQVNLLGEISQRLNMSKLPIPSGSFSFERLEIPFRIEYEKILSDNILLTGPISKLEASGQMNLISNKIDITAKLKLVGNLNIPLISTVINLADPLSKIAEIRISGDVKNPKTEFIVNPFK